MIIYTKASIYIYTIFKNKPNNIALIITQILVVKIPNY
ncbi:hypothetical protein THERMOS_1055 [Bathymodiolus thermophilus thioautotrophic gill symbiont]|uniref:Uncharacterized protein n=1 Tax=Bathymodiolus thermophilus thioautotrophic gill symbiont TaxID=2360 RepID=A0A8H8XBQ4_9GAMM|nr:hypothetical protein THERMOS_1055 [Bathymodiolus thermophilus thioautotrophic gill symbiont]